MGLLERPTSATPKQIRQFGAICFVLLPLVAWLCSANLAIICAFSLVGGLILALSHFLPRAIVPIYLGLSLLTFPIGLLVGELAMLLVFVFVFCPLGFLLKCFHRDALNLMPDSEQDSYWLKKELSHEPESYYRMY